MTPPALVVPRPAPVTTRSKALLSGFHIAALAFQRAHQLKQGARPRVAAVGHKLVTIALLEVMADTISWSVS